MNIDTDQIFENAIRDGIRDGIKTKFNQGYSNPLDKLLNDAIATHTPKLRKLFEDAIASCIGDAEFVGEVASATRKTLAKTLVQRFGGELERQVNTLKSDPTTRARITLAIEEIVKQKAN